MNPTAPVILLAEDDPNDVFFMQRALAKAGANVQLQVVKDGQEALDYFAGSGKYNNRVEFPLPSLAFLDLKMPFVSGFDILAWIRLQPSLNELPVVILTSSAEERDREKAAELGAMAYFIKPPTREMVMEITELLSGGKEKVTVSR